MSFAPKGRLSSIIKFLQKMSKYTLVITEDYESKSHLAIYESDTPIGSISTGDTLHALTAGDDDGSHVYQVVEIRHTITPKSDKNDLVCHEIRLLVELLHDE